MATVRTETGFRVTEEVVTEYQVTNLIQQIQWHNDQIAQIEIQRDKLQAILDTPETAS